MRQARVLWQAKICEKTSLRFTSKSITLAVMPHWSASNVMGLTQEQMINKVQLLLSPLLPSSSCALNCIGDFWFLNHSFLWHLSWKTGLKAPFISEYQTRTNEPLMHSFPVWIPYATGLRYWKVSSASRHVGQVGVGIHLNPPPHTHSPTSDRLLLICYRSPCDSC